MFFQHHRFQIWNANQHPLRHSLNEIPYSNPVLPAGAAYNAQQAIDWLFAVVYPNTKNTVDTPLALPLVGNTLNDYRVVSDDGDGKAASYRWEQREGEVTPTWHKIYDMDWGEGSILSNFIIKTQDMYVFRYGHNDVDPDGNAPAADYRGQHIYGGATAGTHLGLHANAGDGIGPQTGFIMIYDHIKPDAGSVINLGNSSNRFNTGYFDTSLVIGTMSISGGLISDTTGGISFSDENLSTTGTITSGSLLLASGSITDTSGAISFANENLTTTGFLAANFVTAVGAVSSFLGLTVGSTMSLSSGLITDTTGAISFNDENLTTTGSLTASIVSTGLLNVDNIRLDLNTISITNVNGNLTISSNGAGVVIVTSAMTTAAITASGLVQVNNTLNVTGVLNVDNIRIDTNTISSTNLNGTIDLSPNGTGAVTTSGNLRPTTNGTLDLGAASARWATVHIATGISDGTTVTSSPTLQALRNTLGTVTGQSLFWNNALQQWLPSIPDTEIDHGTISGLLDDDHTQYALLAGRSTLQTLNGGLASGNLALRSNATDPTTGEITVYSHVRPAVDNQTDVGAASFRVKDIYMSGQGMGLRAQNFANFAAFPAASGTQIGRLAYDVTEKDLYFDIGGAWKRASTDTYDVTDTTNWNGVITTFTYDVSADVTNARRMVWSFRNVASSYEQMIGASIKFPTTTTVQISFDTPPPSGSYQLVGVGL